MTLEEAIKHTKDIVKDVSECTDCRMEHKQLTGWLEELLAYRKMDKQGRLEHIQEVYLIDGNEIIKCIHLGSSMDLEGNFFIELASYKDIFQYRSSDLRHDLDTVDLSKTTKTVPDDEFGKTVFLTREEAEAKLKEIEESL